MYKESESQKESVIAKLGVLEEERKKLIEEVTTNERQLKETSRVSYIQMNRGMGGGGYGVFSPSLLLCTHHIAKSVYPCVLFL